MGGLGICLEARFGQTAQPTPLQRFKGICS
jgi:hypothetical protein